MRFAIVLLGALLLFAWDGLNAQEAGSAWLGSVLQDLAKEEAEALGLEEPRGVKVIRNHPGSPAETAGLQRDDILLSLDGVEIENLKGLFGTIKNRPVGAEIKLSIRRGGREKRVPVTLTARPADYALTPLGGPLPILDIGGHMGIISDVVFTPDGQQLVSASHDKTIRVWDLATGKTTRTIRGEAEVGNPGKIYAMALSPDGKWLAAGGYLARYAERSPPVEQDAYKIRLFDFASGKLVALLEGHEQVVTSPAFSPDGQRLISGSGDNTAIIWDVAARRPLFRLLGHDAEVRAVAFTADGTKAVTGAFDNDLRLWRVSDGGEIAQLRGHRDKVSALAVAADGTIASGDLSGEIRLWDGDTGALRKILVDGSETTSLSFSPDSRLLLSAVISSSGRCCHVYDLASSEETASYAGHEHFAFAAAISPDGRWAATGGGPTDDINLWDLRTGANRLSAQGQPLRLAGPGRQVWNVGFSANGRRLGWGNREGEFGRANAGSLPHALTLPSGENGVSEPFDLPSEQFYDTLRPLALLKQSAPDEWVFQGAIHTHSDWSLTRRYGSIPDGRYAVLDIKKGEQLVASLERRPGAGLRHNAYSFSPDGGTIISGGVGGRLEAFDAHGNYLGSFIGHEGDIFSIAPSPDGRLLASGASDQTVRLWNLKTREPIVTLFYDGNGQWVMWTPQGYYAASGPGAELIGWQINHGLDHEAEYVTAAQIRKSLNRPDIVARAIELASAEAAVKEAYGTNFKLADLLAKPVPRFRIISPAANAALNGSEAEVTIALEATPDPVKLIRVQVNGQQIAERLPNEGSGFAPGKLTFTVPLAKGANTIRLTAVNETGETSIDVSVNNAREGALDKRGTLYLLAIGVDKYPNVPGNDLRFSGADAAAFADVMEKRVGPQHERVVKRVLRNAASPADIPTAANILNALGLLRQAKETDTVVVFVAGHGVNEGPNYRFLPTDTSRQPDGGFLPASIVPWYAFQEAIEGAKGRRILFLDTCHSGNSYNQRLSNDSYQANIIVYSAARWDQLSWEQSDLGHGLFTHATVEGIEGKAGRREDGGRITTLGLRDFLSKRVAEMAGTLGQSQEPQYFRGRDAENYVLAQGR